MATLSKSDFIIRVNNRKCLTGILEWLKITDEKQIVNTIRAIDKMDRLGNEGVKSLLGKGRKDESGDFTEGADLPEDVIDDLQSQLKYDDEETFTYEEWSKEVGGDAYKDIQSLEDNFKLYDLKNVLVLVTL